MPDDDDKIIRFPALERIELERPPPLPKWLIDDLYTLSGHKTVKVKTVKEWEREMVRRGRLAAEGHDPWRVAITEIGKASVSTVFLGLDHGLLRGGPPLLFETMIFGGALNDYQNRCSTWDEAEKMHEEAVRLVRGSHLRVVE